jgi:hypothetical protein
LFNARPGPEGGEAKFSATFVFDLEAQKTKEYAALKAALKPAAEEKWGVKLPPNLKNPFLDASKYGFPDGWMMIRCNSKQPPGVVDASVNKIIDPVEIYPGAIVIATVNCFTWDGKTGKGISFGLGNVQKVGEGPRLDNRTNADQDFKPIDGGAATNDTVEDIFRT